MDFVKAIEGWLAENEGNPVYDLVAWLKDIIAFIAAL